MEAIELFHTSKDDRYIIEAVILVSKYVICDYLLGVAVMKSQVICKHF